MKDDDVKELRIAVYGERCSGTNLLISLLEENLGCRVTHPVGFKHFPPLNLDVRQKELLADYRIFVIVRHPEDWIRSLYVTPWHAEDAIRGLDFPDFLRHPWRSVWDEEAHVGPDDSRYGQLILSDLPSDGNDAFANPLAMRVEKLARFRLVANHARQATWIRMEDLVTDQKGVFLKALQDLDIEHHAAVKQVRSYKGDRSLRARLLGRLGLFHLTARRRQTRVKPVISEADRAFIWSQLDQAVEASLGYVRGPSETYPPACSSKVD